MDSDANDKNIDFSVHSNSTILKWSDESSKKNKLCRYLEFWVCLLSRVNIQRIFLKSLDYPVSDAECIIVLFSTDLPNKVSFFD